MIRRAILLGTSLTIALLVPGCVRPGMETASMQAEAMRYRPAASLQYPEAVKVDQRDVLHGVEVSDPFRGLEDPDSPASRTWIEAENAVTFGYLEGIPERARINNRMTQLWDYTRHGVPFNRGGQYFYTKNDGLQNQSVWYVADEVGGHARVLLDPNTLSEDGTRALSGFSVSDDGSMVAYGVSDGGSDWQEFFVRDVATGRDLGDHIRWVKFSGASWTHDGAGFYYSRYDAPLEGAELQSANYYQKLYYHRIGTDQSQDELIYEDPNEPEHGFSGSVSDDGRYLIINEWKGTSRKNRISYQDLSSAGSDVVRLIPDFEAQYSFVDNDGPIFWFFTDLDAPRGRVLAIDIRQPEQANWEDVIPQSRDTLRGANVVGESFFASYLSDAHTKVKVYGLNGRLQREVKLPGIGSAFGFGGKRGDSETFFAFSSYTRPTTVFHHDIETGKSAEIFDTDLRFDPSEYVTRQVFYRSADGERIPMFLSHKRGLRLTRNTPTYLYGYGGFNIPITPSFSVPNLVWMEMGGVLAVANLRGGGEYGKDWHDAGKLLNKQNVFDDFISAAEFLIDRGWTSSSKLAIGGRSNGGLLVGACMTQRPELFGACLPGVGVMDMLRFHKFTIGWAWVSDYGSPDEPEHFQNLLGYSPLHNIKEGVCYPPTMVTTGDHDDRVVPAHSFKFAAAMQEAQSCDNPILIRIETRAGHGAGKPTAMRIEEWADQWAFLVDSLNMTVTK